MIRLLVTSGRGPAECRIALAKTTATLLEEATALGIDVDHVSGKDPDGHGPGSALLVLHGADADAFARTWTGTVQWTCPSPLRPHHKRKNWFVGINRLGPRPEMPAAISSHDVRLETLRAGGPGGQHQNKTESAVRAVHVPTGLAVVARQERSQARNKALALERLSDIVRASGELAELADRQAAHEQHDRLARGGPVRAFRGPRFIAD